MRHGRNNRPPALALLLGAATATLGVAATILSGHAPEPTLPPGSLIVLESLSGAEGTSDPFGGRLPHPTLASDAPRGEVALHAIETPTVREVITLTPRPGGRLPNGASPTAARVDTYLKQVAKGPLASFQSVAADGGRLRITFGAQVPDLPRILCDVLGPEAFFPPTPAILPTTPRTRVIVTVRLHDGAVGEDGTLLTAASLASAWNATCRIPDLLPVSASGIRALRVVDARTLEYEGDDPSFRSLAPLFAFSRPGPHPGSRPHIVIPDTGVADPRSVTPSEGAVRTVPIPDPARRADLFRHGQAAVAELDADDAHGLPHVFPLPRLVLAAVFNCRREPYDAARVRRALSLSVPRASRRAARGPFTPLVLGESADDPPPPADLARAVELLTQCGWSDRNRDGIRERHGVKLQPRILVEADRPRDAALAGRIAAAWRDIRVNSTAAAVPPAAFRSALASHDFDVAIVRLSSPPATDPYRIWHSSRWTREGTPADGNLSGYARGEVDEALEVYGMAIPPGKRLAALKRADALIREDAPALFLEWEDTVLAARDAETARRLGIPTDR